MTPRLVFTRIALMLLIAMPVSALLAGGVVWARLRADPYPVVLGQLGMLMYFWGAVTGVLLSLLHTNFSRGAKPRNLGTALAFGAVFGAITGAATPTLLTGFLFPPAMLVGALVGAVYLTLVYRMPDGQRS